MKRERIVPIIFGLLLVRPRTNTHRRGGIADAHERELGAPLGGS
jgi:hypothetical protein